ncbi:MAG: exonuclease domain-containing protein [Bacteroidales bacterium]|jgi:DNA polymerase-3 subunit epsilon
MFAVIDIETTGGSPVNEKITEIAVFIHDGLTIVDEFVTLVNPEVSIPYYITGLTGITNEMVADAPKFYEIARKIVELTEDQVFVAHNVNFDYSFIRQEFKHLGYEYNRKTLDTIRLARQIIPGLPSYSLGKLCASIGIPLNNRHRAGGDALATVKLLEILLSQDHKNIAAKILKPGHPEGLNDHINKEILNKLPDEPGVYYFWNEQHELIYIGKSKDIRSRIFQHLHNQTTRKAMEMRDRIADISWELTGNELIALLLESDEIKKHKPIYNRKQRRSTFNFGLFMQEDKNGYINFSISSTNETDAPLTTFTSKREGRELLTQWVENHKLCHKLSGLYDTAGACFHRGIGECLGACTGEESPESYNVRARNLMRKFEYDHQDFLIIDRGKSKDEIGVICIEKGQYKGFGYSDAEYENNREILRDAIRFYPDNRDIHALIRLYLRKNNAKVLPL